MIYEKKRKQYIDWHHRGIVVIQCHRARQWYPCLLQHESFTMCPGSGDHPCHSCCKHLPSLVCGVCKQIRCRCDNIVLVSDNNRTYISDSCAALPQKTSGFTVYTKQQHLFDKKLEVGSVELKSWKLEDASESIGSCRLRPWGSNRDKGLVGTLR